MFLVLGLLVLECHLMIVRQRMGAELRCNYTPVVLVQPMAKSKRLQRAVALDLGHVDNGTEQLGD